MVILNVLSDLAGIIGLCIMVCELIKSGKQEK